MLTHVSLSLVHVEELDRRALAIITLCCPHLKKLNLCNCEFDDREDEQEINLAGRVTGNTCSFTRFLTPRVSIVVDKPRVLVTLEGSEVVSKLGDTQW